jgi:hypothetical protein
MKVRDGAAEQVAGEWLVQDKINPGRGISGVDIESCDHEHRLVRAIFANEVRELRAVHPRHPMVGEHEVETVLKELQHSFSAAAHDRDFVTVGLEETCEHFTARGIVIHHHHLQGPRRRRDFRCGCRAG